MPPIFSSSYTYLSAIFDNFQGIYTDLDIYFFELIRNNIRKAAVWELIQKQTLLHIVSGVFGYFSENTCNHTKDINFFSFR